MILKVCGLNDVENVNVLNSLDIDAYGFIFYSKSPRSCEISIPTMDGNKVGVFVNESFEEIKKIVEGAQLDIVQLHGNETNEVCVQVKDLGVKVWKAISIDETFDFSADLSVDRCDMYVFDTKGKHVGGNGYKFDWKKLEEYEGNIPFLLSGGISLEDAELVKEAKVKYPQMKGVDVNSGFEIEPGLKKVKELKEFINKIKG